ELRDRENSVGNPDPFYSTLAHELQHLIRFSYSMGLDEVWIDEGTSELMSDLTGFGPQTSRLNCFRGDTSKSDSCSGGVAGVDLFNWNNSLKSYAYAYSFFKYIFSVSNFDTSQKYSFLKSTIQGTNGIRANNTSNLISLFKNSSNYHTQKLGSSNSSVFSKLLGLFLSQSVGYTNLSKVYFGNSTATSLEDIKPYYLMPAEMNPIRSPEGFGSITKYNYFQVYPSSAYRVKGSISGISGSKDLVAIVSDSDFLLYNGSIISGSYGATTTEIEELSNNSDLKVVCPYGDFLEEHKKNFNSRNFLIPHTHNTTKFTGE
ncbi:MAG: hypothetical protein KDK36_04380, partial [Leptospiraceae bacterium]|nr:hypothetical protein [Leptospiraceae bacterium]